MAIHGGVGGAGSEVRGFDVGDFAPVSEAGRRDVGPGLAVIASEMNETSVASGPEETDRDWRRRDGINDAVAAGFGVLDCQGVTRGGLAAFCIGAAISRG